MEDGVDVRAVHFPEKPVPFLGARDQHVVDVPVVLNVLRDRRAAKEPGLLERLQCLLVATRFGTGRR